MSFIKFLISKTIPILVLLIIAIGVPYLIFQAYLFTVSNSYFAVSEIDVQGMVYSTSDELLELGQLRAGMTIFDVNEERLETALNRHPFVKQTSVSKRLPNKVFIAVEEYEPAALVVDENFVLVDFDGVPFKLLDGQDSIDELLKLPMITGIRVQELATDLGRDNLTHALNAINLYQKRGLNALQPLSEVHVDPVMGIALVTAQHSTEIRLGWGRYEERLDRLQAVLVSLAEKNVEADYILVDQEGDLSRVAVGTPLEPGNGDRL